MAIVSIDPPWAFLIDLILSVMNFTNLKQYSLSKLFQLFQMAVNKSLVNKTFSRTYFKNFQLYSDPDYLYLSLDLSQSVHIYIYVNIYIYIYMLISLSIYVNIYLYLSISTSYYLSVNIYKSQSVRSINETVGFTARSVGLRLAR